MRSKQLLFALIAPLAVASLPGCSDSIAQAREEKPVELGREIELTIYSEDFALVNEVRSVQLEPGQQRVDLQHVSKSLDPRSVTMDWAGEDADLPQLVSNVYELGVDSSADLLRRYVGQEVEVVRYDSDGDVAERLRGRLMISGGSLVLESDGKFIVNPQGTLIVPTSSHVVTIPQLSVQVDSQVAKQADLDLSYLSRGLSWSADYVATLLPEGDAISLQCWATVTNETGTTFPSAKVVLMAGAPNRAVEEERRYRDTGQYFDSMKESKATLPAQMAPMPMMAPQSVGDLKAYPVAKPADVVNGQMNRLLMFESKRVPVIMDYSIGMPYLHAWGYGYEPEPRMPVQMAFSFKNEQKSGLGDALPAGALRVYGNGAGSKRYLGAASVQDTPTDAKVDVTLANAFDLYASSKVVENKRINKKTVRKTVEIVLSNEKEVKTDVRVVQPIYGKFKLVDESIKGKSLDASNLQWTVPVPAGGKETLRFTLDLTE